jgi:hypothetical protein
MLTEKQEEGGDVEMKPADLPAESPKEASDGAITQKDLSLFAQLMPVQKQAFKDQLVQFHQLVFNHGQATGTDPLTSKPVAKIPKGTRKRKRPNFDEHLPSITPDDLEKRLLQLLNDQGGLLMGSRTQTFLDLMTQAKSVEKRALLLTIILATDRDKQRNQLIEMGCLRVLKIWLIEAAEAQKLELVLLLLETLKALPVTEMALRTTEIYKPVKKCKKMTSAPDVQSCATALINQWQETMKQTSGGSAPPSTKTEAVAAPSRIPKKSGKTSPAGEYCSCTRDSQFEHLCSRSFVHSLACIGTLVHSLLHPPPLTDTTSLSSSLHHSSITLRRYDGCRRRLWRCPR